MNAETLLANGLIDLDHAGLSHRNQTPARLREVGVPDGVILDAVRAFLGQRVDRVAEALRASVVTSGAGQMMEYQEAASQAFAALDAEPATLTAERYPMLAATVGVDVDPETGAKAVDILGVARSVKRAYLQWNAIGSAIRGARLAGKRDIAEAATPEAAAAAYDAIVWPALT